MPRRKSKEQVCQDLKRADDREPKTRVVKNCIRRLGVGKPIQILVNGVKLIERMARKGHGNAGIATSLGISAETLAKAADRQEDVRLALETGRAGLEDELHSILLAHARGERGDAKTSMICAIYLSKAKHNWRDGGEPVARAQNNIVIHLPDSKSPEEWLKALPVATDATLPGTR